MEKLEKDYSALLRLFNKHKVRYCIIGAYAVAFYAVPRYSKDIDILVEPSLENGKRVVAALDEFGFGSLKLTPQDFTQVGHVIQLGYEPIRIDLLTSIEGCTFKEVWKTRKRGKYGQEIVFFIGIQELIKNKRTSGRKQDQADVDTLLKIRKSH